MVRGRPSPPRVEEHGAPAVGATYDANDSRLALSIDIAERPACSELIGSATLYLR
jgi:hypothetical protein